jgi:hypothetical protein
MMEGIRETSPRFEAGITGAFCLLTILPGIFAPGFRERQPCCRRRRCGYGDQHTDAHSVPRPPRASIANPNNDGRSRPVQRGSLIATCHARLIQCFA